jgi:hypothetical protein
MTDGLRSTSGAHEILARAKVLVKRAYDFWERLGSNKKCTSEYALVGIILLVISIVFTGGVIFNASTRLFTFGIGDATSGFTWILYAQNHLPLFSQYSHLVNYPFGENLIGPDYITWTLVYAPLYVLARILSALAAMNIMTLVGLVSSGLVMYAVIKKLTHKWYLAFVAAYAAAFMPYHMVNATGHLTNVFSWVFTATIASFIAFWEKQTFRRGILLALAIVAAGYTDGYFVFIESVLLFALFFAVLITDVLTKNRPEKILVRLKGISLVAVVVVVLLSPVALTQVLAGQRIQQTLSGLRSNIKQEVASYTVQPIDMLLPGQGNALVGNSAWYKHDFAIKDRHSNNVENTNYIGYTILFLFLVAAVYSLMIAWHRWRRNNNSQPVVTDYMMTVCVIAAPLAFIWMLPPTLFGIKMPIGYLTDHIAYWRVPARVFLAMQPLMVIAATLAVNKFINKKYLKPSLGFVIAAVWFCLLAAEYNVNVYRPAFGFQDMPHAYTWLAQQKDIRAIAEIPMIDRPVEVTGYYVFAQMISGKPIVNDQLSLLPPGEYNTMGDLSNPETINFIRSRGINTVVEHTSYCQSYGWGKLLYKESNALSPPTMDEAGSTICIYRIDTSAPLDPYYARATSGFQDIDYRDQSGRYWLILGNNHPSLQVVDNRGRPIADKNAKARFTSELSFVGNAPYKQLNWVVSQGGKTVASGYGFRDTVMSATVNVSEPIDLAVTTNSYFRVPKPGEADIRGVQITKLH